MNKLRIVLPLGRFFLASEIYAGAGSSGVLSALGAARIAILLSPSLARNEIAMAPLKRAVQKTVARFIPMPAGEPTLTGLAETLREVMEFRPDWIVGAGGGAVLDGAKLIWALYEHPGLSPEELTRPHGLPPLRGKAKFAAIPTTAGSGSESSSAATFQFTPNGRKAFLVSHELIPDVALLDPVLLRDLPPAAFGFSALDALAHAVEGCGSRYANSLTDMMAESAARRILTGLDRAIADPGDLAARTDIMVAACIAGGVQNFAVPGVGHAIAHQLAASHIAHAVGTGGLLASSISVNSALNADTKARYDRFGGAIGFGDSAGLAEAILALRQRIGLDAVLKERLAGLNWRDDAFVDGVLGDPCARANPVPVDSQLINAVIEGALR